MGRLLYKPDVRSHSGLTQPVVELFSDRLSKFHLSVPPFLAKQFHGVRHCGKPGNDGRVLWCGRTRFCQRCYEFDLREKRRVHGFIAQLWEDEGYDCVPYTMIRVKPRSSLIQDIRNLRSTVGNLIRFLGRHKLLNAYLYQFEFKVTASSHLLEHLHGLIFIRPDRHKLLRLKADEFTAAVIRGAYNLKFSESLAVQAIAYILKGPFGEELYEFWRQVGAGDLMTFATELRHLRTLATSKDWRSRWVIETYNDDGPYSSIY